jgi:hypothetical protein
VLSHNTIFHQIYFVATCFQQKSYDVNTKVESKILFKIGLRSISIDSLIESYHENGKRNSNLNVHLFSDKISFCHFVCFLLSPLPFRRLQHFKKNTKSIIFDMSSVRNILPSSCVTQTSICLN